MIKSLRQEWKDIRKTKKELGARFDNGIAMNVSQTDRELRKDLEDQLRREECKFYSGLVGVIWFVVIGPITFLAFYGLLGENNVGYGLAVITFIVLSIPIGKAITLLNKA